MATTGPDPRRRARPGEGAGSTGRSKDPESGNAEDREHRENAVRPAAPTEAIPTRVKVPGQQRPVTKPPTTKPVTGRDRARELKLEDKTRTTVPDRLGDQLEAKLIEWTAWLTPTAEEYGAENADKAARALMQLGSRYDLILKLLIRWVMSESAVYIIKYLAGLSIAVRVDFEQVHPDSKISKWTGVTPAWDKTHNRAVDIQRFAIGPAVATTGWRGSSERDQWVQYEPPFQFVPVDTNWERRAAGAYSHGPLG